DAEKDRGQAQILYTRAATLRDGERRPQPVIETEHSAEGRVHLVNHWHQPVTFLVDNTPHVVGAGEIKRVHRKSGDFTYEIQGIRSRVTQRLEPNHDFTITVYARR